MPERNFILLGSLLVSAFFAATLLPGGSEAALAGLLLLRPELTLPAILTRHRWATRRAVEHLRAGSPGAAQGTAAPPRAGAALWQRVALLLSWLPLLGDGLCAAAGLLRLNGFACLVWMAIGKGARYLVLAWALQP